MASKRGGTVLIVGGGIAGATAADRLSRAGVNVHLLEREKDIGGHAGGMGCKATDTCLRCNVCVADEIFRSVRTASGVQLHTSVTLEQLEPGQGGWRFRAVLKPNNARGSKNRPGAVNADAVIIATGFEPYDPKENSSYHYGRLPNVITGIEAERQLAEQRGLTRPSDGLRPRRIAFVQCVGSRTEEAFRRPEDTDYCSAVCCSYALRIGQRIVHEASDSDVTVFYMDIQNFGKGFHEFYGRCRDKMRFIRSRPYELLAGENDSVRVKYTPEAGGKSDARSVCEETFDLVVLSIGMRPPADAGELAGKLGIALDRHGFFGLKGACALPRLQKEGIYVAGAGESPKDIAACIAQAEAVGSRILADLGRTIAPRNRANNLASKANFRALPKSVKSKGKSIRREVVVVGGGVAGMQAALGLADLGHRVSLVHGAAELGGTAAELPELYSYLEGDAETSAEEVRAAVDDLAGRVLQSRKITLHSGSRPVCVEGETGDFLVTVATDGKRQVVKAGAIVLACGTASKPAGPAGSQAFTDMKGLVARIRSGGIPSRTAILMDLSAEQGRSISAQALSAAELLAERGSKVTVYCNNVRVAAAGMESLYRRAREAGAAVLKYTSRPRVAASASGIRIDSVDPVAGVVASENYDLVVSADVAPSGDAEPAVPIRFLRLGPSGDLQADDVWLMPGLTNRPGVFVAGGARGNSEFRDALTDGLAVAGEVHGLLAGKRFDVGDDAAVVDPDKCVVCLTCMRICPHGAIRIDEGQKAAVISEVACQRCGICAAECPAEAITLPRFTNEIMSSRVGKKPRVTIFACENSAIPAAEAAGALKRGAKVDLISVPCAGEVEPRTILAALEKGARKVMVLGCHPENCQYLHGSSRAAKRIERIGSMLQKAGIDKSRVRFGGIASVEPYRFKEYVGS